MQFDSRCQLSFWKIERKKVKGDLMRYSELTTSTKTQTVCISVLAGPRSHIKMARPTACVMKLLCNSQATLMRSTQPHRP